jgi:hypothetical protein
MYLRSLLKIKLLWRLILVGLMLLGHTLQRNVTQKDFARMDMEMASFEDLKILEQTETKKSIIPESSSKEVQNDLLPSLDASSTNASFF